MAVLPKPYEPLDIVKFIHDMVEQWNDEEKCDLCWAFTAPMRDSDLNEYQFRDESGACCVLVAVTDYRFATNRRYASSSLVREKFTSHDFRLNFLVRDEIGKNVYNEIKNHELRESKWATILKPIYDCISVDEVLDFCETLGYNVDINSWRGSMKIDWLDNYTGWSIDVSLTERF